MPSHRSTYPFGAISWELIDGGDGEEEDGLSRSAARLEERRSDQEVRAERWKERRLLL